nr:DUF3095 domain-containing protein [Rhizobium glycinendophyticum]
MDRCEVTVMSKATASSFFLTIPAFEKFEGVIDDGNYHPLPDGWMLAVADIVDSTAAIAAGRYKSVNLAGVAVISAILNGTGEHDLPFIFGGDGALVAVPPEDGETARTALAAVRRWVEEEYGLDMRTALVPVADIRAHGQDVRLARFAVSEGVTYAMFSGGGSHWAEAEMKAGRYLVDPAPPGTQPNLSGLSCRWQPIAARNGAIASIIAQPAAADRDREFRRLVGEIVTIASADAQMGHPVADGGPTLGLTLEALNLEARATAPPGRRLQRKLYILLQYYLTAFLHRTRLKFGRFDAHDYVRDVRMNTDFRKFDDGLKMTVDTDPARLARIRDLLETAAAAGICRYGLHLQESALMTCFVPTPLERGHMHFIDGAAGGYAVAASRLKLSVSGDPLGADPSPARMA